MKNNFMRLYSKIKSDRAEKAQGGNKKISIELFVGDAKNSMKIAEGELEALPQGGYNLYFSSVLPDESENQCVDMHIEESELKGERQKGEHVCTVFLHGRCAGCGAEA